MRRDGQDSPPISALVVDDAVLYRMLVSEGVDRVDGFRVIGQAANGAIAMERVRELRPQLVLLDLEMPVMDGMAVLRALQREGPQGLQTLIISSQSTRGARITLDALQLGAFDFITKPAEGSIEKSREQLFNEIRAKLEPLRERLRGASASRPGDLRDAPDGSAPAPRVDAASRSAADALRALRSHPVDVVGIGVSTGGPQALGRILPGVRAPCPPILIVQHMPATFLTALADKLDQSCQVSVVEAAQGMSLDNDHIYIAPGGQQMSVRRRGLRAEVVLRDDPAENHCRPAVDYLFRGIADAYGGRAVGMVLTGMGNDGATGLLAMKNSGAFTAVQDEATCTVYGMPRQALQAGAATYVLSLEALGQLLGALRS